MLKELQGAPSLAQRSREPRKDFWLVLLLPVLLVASEALFRASPASAAITFVQAAQSLNSTSGSSVSVTMSNNVAGDFLVVACREGLNQTATLSMTDTAGNTYTLVNSSGSGGSGNRKSALFYAANINSAASNTISCNFAPSVSGTVGIVALEFAGVATSSPTDGNVTSSNSASLATSLSSGNLTTTNANDLLIYEVNASVAETTYTAGTGYTIPTNGSNGRQAVQYQIVSATGTYSTSVTWNAGAYSDGVFAAFKAAVTCSAVADASYVAANAQATQAIVYWASSNAALILQKATAAITDAPVNYTSYSVGNTIGASTVVYNGSVAETSFTQTGLTNGTTYYYKVFPKSGTCYAPGIR